MRLNQMKSDGGSEISATVVIRRLRDDESDRTAIEALAERDSGAVPGGEILVAEVEGAILAAISLDSGALLADPFSRTNELRNLLQLRRAQLRRRLRSGRLPALRHRGRSRGALAASPPGAGGRLLQLGSGH
jgi:hypothetical protein